MTDLYTPQFGRNGNSPRVKLSAYISSSTAKKDTIQWWLSFENETGSNPGWGELTCWAGLGSTTFAAEDFTITGYGDGISSGTFTVDRGATERAEELWLSINLSGYVWGGENGGNWTGDNAISGSLTIPAISAPSAPTIGTNTRSSDTKNTVTWTNNAAAADYDSIFVYRSADGGAWQKKATLSQGVTSWTDTTTQADHSYKYKVAAYNGKYGYSAASSETFNSPAAPKSVSGARTSGNTIKFAISNTSNVATGIELAYSSDKSSWTTVTPTSTDGTPATAAYYSTTGTYWWRVRNVSTHGGTTRYSTWTVSSDKVVVASKPNAPTITSPAPSAYFGSQAGSVDISWAFNPTDGSEQTAYQLMVNGTELTSVTSSAKTASVAVLSLNIYPTNVGGNTVKVRTRGASSTWSEYSEEVSFSVLVEPSISFAIGNDSAGYTLSPIRAVITAYSTTGRFVRYSVKITSSGGGSYSESGNVSGMSVGEPFSWEKSIPRSKLSPSQGDTITASVYVMMSTGLSARQTFTYDVNFKPCMGTVVKVVSESSVLTPNVKVTFGDATQTKAKASLANVSRYVCGEKVTIAEDVSENAVLRDLYCPLNTDVQYTSVGFTANGAESEEYTSQTYRVVTEASCIIFDEEVLELLAGRKEANKVTRSDASVTGYWGQTYPSASDSEAMRRQIDISFNMTSREEREAFERLLSHKGTQVYKTVDGEVFHVKAMNGSFQYIGRSDLGREVYSASVSMQRVNGGEL